MKSALVLLVAVGAAACSRAVHVDVTDSFPGAPAVVVGVRHPDGRREVKGYGALDDGRAPDGETAFEVGSLTKTFTALLYARAVVDGKVTPTTTLGQRLGASLPATAPAASITLESLATHTSGLPRLPANHAPKSGDDPYADYDVARLVDALAHVTLVQPGVVAYSNFGMGALGYALTKDRVGGYGGALRDDVTAALGIFHTTAFAPFPGARPALPHDMLMKPVSVWHQTEATAGAGALWSTANDLLVVSEALLRARPGSPSAITRALSEVKRVRVAASEGRPALALAWHVRDDGVLWHNGGTGGTTTVWDVDARTGCAVVILANAAQFDDDGAVNRVLRMCQLEATSTSPPLSQ